MIELLPSGDGRHTVHVSAQTPEELAELVPKARALYEKIIESYGNKVQMWQLSIDQAPARLKNTREIPAKTETYSGRTPTCPMHGKLMKLRQGKYGAFWSCAVRNPNGLWCQVTRETDSHGDDRNSTA